MYEHSQVLARNLASLAGEGKKRHARGLKADRVLQVLLADLIAAVAVGAAVEIRVRIGR